MFLWCAAQTDTSTFSFLHNFQSAWRTLSDGHILACGFIRIAQQNEDFHYIWSVFARFDLIFHRLKLPPATTRHVPVCRRTDDTSKAWRARLTVIHARLLSAHEFRKALRRRQVDGAHESGQRQPLFVTVYKWWVTPCLAAAPWGWLNIPCYPSGRAAGRGDAAGEPLRCRSAEPLQVFQS